MEYSRFALPRFLNLVRFIKFHLRTRSSNAAQHTPIFAITLQYPQGHDHFQHSKNHPRKDNVSPSCVRLSDRNIMIFKKREESTKYDIPFVNEQFFNCTSLNHGQNEAVGPTVKRIGTLILSNCCVKDVVHSVTLFQCQKYSK